MKLKFRLWLRPYTRGSKRTPIYVANATRDVTVTSPMGLYSALRSMRQRWRLDRIFLQGKGGGPSYQRGAGVLAASRDTSPAPVITPACLARDESVDTQEALDQLAGAVWQYVLDRFKDRPGLFKRCYDRTDSTVPAQLRPYLEKVRRKGNG